MAVVYALNGATHRRCSAALMAFSSDCIFPLKSQKKVHTTWKNEQHTLCWFYYQNILALTKSWYFSSYKGSLLNYVSHILLKSCKFSTCRLLSVSICLHKLASMIITYLKYGMTWGRHCNYRPYASWLLWHTSHNFGCQHWHFCLFQRFCHLVCYWTYTACVRLEFLLFLFLCFSLLQSRV